MLIRIFRSAFFSVIFTISITSFAEVGKKEFESVEKTAKYILSHYPSDQYVYVGIGRAPVPVMAYLQTEDQTLVRNIPLTNFRHGAGGYLERQYEPLSPREETILFYHFDRHLPQDSELGGRTKLVLVDFAFGGKSIAAAQLYFNRYIENHRKIFAKVSAVAIVLESDKEPLKNQFPDLDLFPLPGSDEIQFNPEKMDHFLTMMAAKLYRDIAEFPGFDIKKPAIFEPRQEYLNYVQEIKGAKSQYTQGLLNDDWTNTLFEQANNPDFMSKTGRSLNNESDPRSDAEKTSLIKEMISKIVSEKRSKAADLNYPQQSN